MARPKKTYQCYACKSVQFTFEKGYANDNGVFIKDDFRGSVRKVETLTRKIHYCSGVKTDNISGTTVETMPEFNHVEPEAKPESVKNAEVSKPLTEYSGELSAAGLEIFKLIEPALRAKLLDIVSNLETKVIHEIHYTKDDVTKVLTGAHKQTATLIRYLSLGLNVLLVGPAGSGKTYAAHVAAEHLTLNYYPQSVGPQTSKSDLIGYMDALGKLVRTPAREAFEHGGVWLIDEIDAANPAVLTIINMMLANSHASFPDGTIARHPDFRVIASANTYGNGANRMYVGRNQLDAATLDRFVGIDWAYDMDFERTICPNTSWLNYIWKLREAQDRLKIRVVISMRAIIDGGKMLAAGISQDETENAKLWFGVSADDKSKLLSALR